MTHAEMLAAMDEAVEELSFRARHARGVGDAVTKLLQARQAVAALTGETVTCHQCEAVLFGADEPLPKVVFP